ncbi:hypothetical protein [Candidatus Nitrotoga arctica]|uniref:Uncharacterized protein n=1 Tax=Candidatus Nitrotoga arctica TaxID=453162 RepID=A0ABM8YV17_9PROT|nr:hypothetical protein [Candidatus Nitrotoga arctica]CAG9931308.1 protein of unknown function [Candidatus Nitrotoga arctica]
MPELLHQVLREFTAARGREGDKLQEFLLQRIAQIETLCTLVAPRIPQQLRHMKKNWPHAVGLHCNNPIKAANHAALLYLAVAHLLSESVRLPYTNKCTGSIFAPYLLVHTIDVM